MSIVPQTSANVAFWNKMLVRSRGTVFCSNLMIYADLATQSIDDGGLVTVAYDPRTPNSTELIAIIEAAGYGARAASVLLMLSLGISGTPNWATIVNDANLMMVIWGNGTARGAVFNSAEAMAAVASSATARNALFTNTTALNEFWGHNDATTRALNVSAFVTAVVGNNVVMDSLLNNTVNWTRVVNQAANMTVIAGNTNFMNRIRANTTALPIMLNAAPARLAIAASTNGVNSLIGDATSRTTLFAHYDTMRAIVDNATGWAAIWANSAAMSALVVSQNCMKAVGAQPMPKTVLKQILQNATHRAAIAGSANAKLGLQQASDIIIVIYEGTNFQGTFSGPAWISQVSITCANEQLVGGATVTTAFAGLTDAPTSVNVGPHIPTSSAYYDVHRYAASTPTVTVTGSALPLNIALGVYVRGLRLPA